MDRDNYLIEKIAWPLIALCILGILAAIIVPRVNRNSSDSTTEAVSADTLQVLTGEKRPSQPALVLHEDETHEFDFAEEDWKETILEYKPIGALGGVEKPTKVLITGTGKAAIEFKIRVVFPLDKEEERRAIKPGLLEIEWDKVPTPRPSSQ